MKHLKNLFFLCASIVLITISCSKSVDTNTSGNWVQKYQIGGWPRNGASSWVIGDTGYIVAGFNYTNDSCLSDLWQFDPNKNNWSQKAYLPGLARHSGVGFAIGLQGYIATGYNPNTNPQNFQDCWQYTPATNSWKQMASLPDMNGPGTGARYDAVAFSIGNYGYVGTGYNGAWLKDFWKLDPVANTWTAITNLPGNKRSGAVAFTHMDTAAFIVTGTNNGTELHDFWKYNPTSGWIQLRDIANTSTSNYDDAYTNIVRDHAVAMVRQNSGVWKAYIALGQNGSLLNATWEYDIATDLWTAKTPYERSARQGAVSWSFINLKNTSYSAVPSDMGRAFCGTGKSASLSLDDYDEWYPADTYNAND